MSFSASAAAVYFIACHGGPADHFATFAESLSTNVQKIEIYASGPALKKFQDRGINVQFPFSLEGLSPQEEDTLAETIAKTCSTASVVITDVGHAFDIKVQKALERQASHIPRFAYYDNPESYVPGGYSTVAAQVMLASNGILFANAHLAQNGVFQEPGKEIDFQNREKIGIGYYPITQAKQIAERRACEQSSARQQLFAKNNLVDTGQKVLVYFGGNNEEYFSKALPAFLTFLNEGMEQSDLSHLVIIMQQHPGAKSNNIDGNQVSAWISQHGNRAKAPKIIVSDFPSDHAQTIADGALYYQTSMGPQFVLAGIPAIQIGHQTFEDILVRNGLSPTVTNVDQFIKVMNGLTTQKKEIPRETILKGLGISEDWLPNLEKAIKANHKA
jgi:hypothetical protein